MSRGRRTTGAARSIAARAARPQGACHLRGPAGTGRTGRTRGSIVAAVPNHAVDYDRPLAENAEANCAQMDPGVDGQRLREDVTEERIRAPRPGHQAWVIRGPVQHDVAV